MRKPEVIAPIGQQGNALLPVDAQQLGPTGQAAVPLALAHLASLIGICFVGGSLPLMTAQVPHRIQMR